ncbi:poly-gamma-glutamate system protein [Francisellaceae bacterium CB299]|jgi:poly-gamma-glutamate system protein
MKTIYWHRKFLSRYIISFLTIFMILSLYIVEKNLVVETKGYTQKVEASNTTYEAFRLTQDFFISKGYLCKNIGDVSCTGLIGLSMSEITTDSGDLYSKRSSVNPNMAAIFVAWLSELDLKKGDVVALQQTGSYPALDIAMLSAIKTLELKPLIIFSVGASQFGANRANFTWPDIYKNLVEKGLFNYDILGATLGGSRDNGYGMTPAAVLKLNDSIKRNGYKTINIPYHHATTTSIKTRLDMYKKAAGDEKIKAYINVGGNMASIGLKQPKVISVEEKDGKKKTVENKVVTKLPSFPTGVVKELPTGYSSVRSVAVDFLKEGVPVVNIRDISSSIIKKYGLTYNPATVTPAGQGAAFSQKNYNTTLAIVLLIIDITIIIAMALISRKYLISYKSK